MKKYIITYNRSTNEGTEGVYCLCDDSSVERYLADIVSKTGGWGNTNITCYELGKEVEWEEYMKVTIKGG